MINGLSTEQLEQFDSDGYLIVYDVFSEDDLAPLINDIPYPVTMEPNLVVEYYSR